MKDKNTLSMGFFVFNIFLYTVVANLFFCQTLGIFRIIPGTTYFQSKVTVLAFTMISGTLGFIATYKRRRNYLSIIVNILFPIEMYALLVYIPDFTNFCFLLFLSTVLLCSGYLMLLFSAKKPENVNRKEIMLKMIRDGVLGVKTIFSLVFSLLLIILTINVLAVGSIFPIKEKAQVSSTTESYTVSEQLDAKNFQEDTWKTFTTYEKGVILQKIANYETYRLGHPHELNIVIQNLDEHTLANYCDQTHTILFMLSIKTK